MRILMLKQSERIDIMNPRKKSLKNILKKQALILAAVAALGTITITGCNRGGPGRPQMSGEQAAVPVLVEKVERRDLTEYITISGKLEGMVDVTLLSETNGRVTAIHKHLGDRIEEGERLGSIDNEVYRIGLSQAHAALSSAGAGLRTAEMNYETTKKLFENGTASQVEYQQAKVAYQAAIAQRDGANAGLETAKRAYANSRLVSPVSGYIAALHLKIGETIFPNAPVAAIIDRDRLILRSGVSERHVRSVSRGQRATVHYQGEQYPAVVRGVGLKPAANASSYPIEVELDNRDGKLVPGMIVRVTIETNIYRDVIYTETGNIQISYDDSFVYTADEDSQAVRTDIVPGLVVNEYTLIQEGLEIGSRIIVEGQEALEEGMIVNIRN